MGIQNEYLKTHKPSKVVFPRWLYECHCLLLLNSGLFVHVARNFIVNPKKYAHGFVVLCFVVVMQSFIMNSHKVFIHIHQGCFAGTGAIVRLPQCQWSKPDGYGKISQCITATKHSKAKTLCIFLGIYCLYLTVNHYIKFNWLGARWNRIWDHSGDYWHYNAGTTNPFHVSITLWKSQYREISTVNAPDLLGWGDLHEKCGRRLVVSLMNSRRQEHRSFVGAISLDLLFTHTCTYTTLRNTEQFDWYYRKLPNKDDVVLI